MSTLDCGDNSCEFAKVKTGMRTNGGCRCLKDLSFDRRMAVRRYILTLKSELSEWQETARNEMAGRASAEAEVKRLEGLILDWRVASFTGNTHEYQLAAEALVGEVRRIRAQREEGK